MSKLTNVCHAHVNWFYQIIKFYGQKYSFNFAIRYVMMDFRSNLPTSLVTVIMLWLSGHLSAQQVPSLVQFSGTVFALEGQKKLPLPYANIGLPRTHRGCYSNDQGFFSMPAQTGDTVLVQYLGFKTQSLRLPDQLTNGSYYIEILMYRDTFELQRTTIYPIPSKEHFRPEFLAMDVSDPLKELAEKNLSSDVLARIAPGVPADGRQTVNLYFQQQAVNAVYEGQFKPQNIFNPMAWIEFINALKRGDFKNKRKPPK